MPVFDFRNTPDTKTDNRNNSICTYTTFRTNDSVTSPEKPILILDNHIPAAGLPLNSTRKEELSVQTFFSLTHVLSA